MRAKFVSTLSVVSVLGLLLCAPLAAQDEPQEQPAEEEGLVQVPAQELEAEVPAQELEQELKSAQSDRAQQGQDETARSEAPESEITAGEGSEEPATTEASKSGADERSIENMPKTASPLALVALIGASSIAGGLGLRRFRRK
jgi:hypothetical protein